MYERTRVFCMVSLVTLINNKVIRMISLCGTFTVQRTEYVQENSGSFA